MHFAFNNFFQKVVQFMIHVRKKKQNSLLGFHCNNDYAKAPLRYVLRTLPLLSKMFNNFNHNFTTWIKMTDTECVKVRPPVTSQYVAAYGYLVSSMYERHWGLKMA